MIVLSLLLTTLLAPPAAPRQARTVPDTAVITGTITDRATHKPLPNTTVAIGPHGPGTTSGPDGRYRLQLTVGTKAPTVDVIVRRIGYTPELRHVTLTARVTTLDIALAQASLNLSEVVVTGGNVSNRAYSAPHAMAIGIAKMAASPSMAYDRSRIARTERTDGRRVGVADSIADEQPNRDQYAALVENPFLDAHCTPLSTFSIDVDRASYADVRRYLTAGTRPPRDAVRIEELVNYFRYDYHAPAARSAAPLDVTVETHAAPWQPTHRLIRIGMQAQRLPISDLPPANLVFLIDVSGSMDAPNRLPLVIKSLRLLTAELRAQDRVAIAVYAGAAGLVLPSTPGTDKARIFDALDRLQAGGSTNGGAGIRLAYKTAREHFLAEGANRVILATDGDFNVGTTSDSDLIQLIESERASGVFLTVLGFGMGNTQHAKMEQLADKGNGQYAYIDDIAEAQKALVREMGGTLFTLAKDVKLQVEFNPARVRSYRLLGYENRLLRDEDFNDDTKDAGELGAGHSVTALYEVELTDSPRIATTGTVDPLRFGTRTPRTARDAGDELAFVKVRYQPPKGGTSALLSWPVTESAGAPSVDYTFASAVAGFGLLLRDSPHKGNLTWPDVRRLAERGQGSDADGDRAGFLTLVGMAERVTGTTARAVTPR